MPRKPNPYIAGPPVSGPNFYGREDIFRFVENTFSSPQQNVIVLYGQRRMGKTSVLHELSSRLSPEFHPIYFDLQGKAQQRLNKVLYDLASAIAGSLNLDSPPKADFLHDDDHFHERFLPQVYQSLGAKRLLLMFDEFETVDMPPVEGPTGKDVAYRAFFPYLHGRLVGDRRLAFIFATGRRLDELDELILSLFKEARTESVSFLEEAGARQLVVEPALGSLEYDEEAAGQIVSITACHPYLTQLICFELFGYMEAGGRSRVTIGDVEAVVDKAIAAGGAGLVWLWDGLPMAERFVLSAVAHVIKEGHIATQDEISRILEAYRVPFSGPDLTKASATLIRWELLRHTADGYEFVVELLRRWILRDHSLEQVRRELESASPRAIQLYEQAFKAHQAGERDRAIRYYKYALAANPNYSQARLGLAQVLLEQGRIEEAITEFEGAYALDRARAQYGLIKARQAWADVLEKEGRVNEADQEYETILGIAPHDPRVREWVANRWTKRGKKYLAEGYYEEAVAEHKKAAELNVPDVREELITARQAWAEALEGDGKGDKADRQYEAILRIAPKDNKLKEWVASCWMARGKKYLRGEHYEDAVAEYNKAVALDVSGTRKGLIAVRQVWAEALEREGKVNEADHQYETILGIDPDDDKLKEWVANCWMARGKKYLGGARYEDAVAEYDKAVDLEVAGALQGLIAARQAWAEALERGGKAGEADQQYDMILDLAPYNVKVREWIASSLIGRGDRYLEEGRYDGASKAYDQAESIRPEKQQALAQRRHQLRLAPDYDKAMEAHKAGEWGIAWERWTELYREDPSYRGRDGKGKRVAELLKEALDEREKVTGRRWKLLPLLGGLAVVFIVLIIGFWIGLPSLWSPSPTPTLTAVMSVTPGTPIVMVSPTHTATLTPSPTERSTIPLPTTVTATPTSTPSPTIATATSTLTPSPTATATPTATPLPPVPLGTHRILDVDINPGNNEIMYVVAKGEGIYRTTDGGYRWELIKALPNIESLTLGQANPQMVFASADRFILKSTDGGGNWQPCIEIKDQRNGDRVLKGAIHVLAVVSDDDQIVYAGTDEGVYRSEDGGVNWERKLGNMGGREICTLAVASDDGQLVYAAGEGPEVWRTFDGGNLWKKLSLRGEIGAIYTLGLHRAPDYEKNRLYIGADNSTVAVSADGGHNWRPRKLGNERAPPLRDPLKIVAVTILDFRDSETILLAATGDRDNLFRNGIYKSTDDGLSWKPRNKGLPTDSSGPYSVHSIGVDPQNNQVVYAGTFSGLYKSTNGGESWTRIP